MGSVSDPDRIQIQLGLWIQILTKNPDPEPGRQKWNRCNIPNFIIPNDHFS